MRVLLVALWCASAIAAGVAVLAWTPRPAGIPWRRGLLLFLVGVPLAFELLLAGVQAWLLVVSGGGVAPVTFATACVTAHGTGLVLASRAMRTGWRPDARLWSASALVGCAVSLLLFGLLVARAELHAARLQVEAGELAHELLAPPPRPEDDAWPVYVEFESQFEQVVDLDAWIADVKAVESGAALDFEDEARRARLARAAPLLAEARRASELPDCDFSGRRSHGRHDFFAPGHALVPAVTLKHAWMLEGAYAVATGRTDLALEDYAALVRLSEQAAASPLLLDLLVGLSCRLEALGLLGRILPVAEEASLEQLRAMRPAPLTSNAARALDMEFAWALSSMGMVWGRDPRLAGLPWTPSRWVDSLYLAFRFEADMAGYREGMAESRALATGSLEALRRARDSGVAEGRARSRGPMASYLLPLLASHLWSLRRADAQLELAAEAVEALLADREQALARGTWTADDPDWGDDPPSFTLR